MHLCSGVLVGCKNDLYASWVNLVSIILLSCPALVPDIVVGGAAGVFFCIVTLLDTPAMRMVASNIPPLPFPPDNDLTNCLHTYGLVTGLVHRLPLGSKIPEL